MAGETHLSLCQRMWVSISREAPAQGSALNWCWRISRATTMAGRTARPMPTCTHCLMASTLENSVTLPGRTFWRARA